MTSKTPRHILQLSTEEKRAFLQSFDLVFTDIDGVLWNVWDSVKGVSDGYSALENTGKKISLITNNSVRSSEALERKFKREIKKDIDLESVWHPATSIVKYLKGINFQGLIYVIGSETFKKILRDAGFEFIDGPNEIIAESFGVLAGHIFDKQPVRAVVVDVDFNMSSVKMIRAQLYLKDPNCLFIAGATDMLLPVHPEINILGPGPFVKILKEYTKNELITLGKPGAALAQLLRKECNLTNPKRALMIGDMLEQDIGFGAESGFQTLLVLSGGCKLPDLLSEKNPQYIPDYYADSVHDFVEFINDVNKSHV